VWEGYFLDVGKACQEGMECFRYSGRSFSDEFGAAIKGDVVLMNIGFLIIIIYLAVNLSGKGIIGSKVRMGARTSHSERLRCSICVSRSFGANPVPSPVSLCSELHSQHSSPPPNPPPPLRSACPS